MMERIKIICVNILPMSLVVFMVIGFIILGWATPTEAAAFGVFGVFILAVLFRALTFKAIYTAVEATVKVGAMVFFIIMSSTVFSQLLAFSGASAGLLKWAASFEVSKYTILFVMFVILIALGMFMFYSVQAMENGVRVATTATAEDATLVVYREDRFCPFTSRLPEDY